MIVLFISAIENESDRALAESLYLEYRQIIYAAAFGYLGDAARAEDAVCDVLERVCKNIAQFRGRDRDTTRLLIIVYSRNVCRNSLKRGGAVFFEELHENMPSQDGRPEAIALERDGFARICALVEGLDAKYADVCKLKFFAGLSDAEIAAALEISHENVRVRLTRSREMIRRRLAEQERAI